MAAIVPEVPGNCRGVVLPLADEPRLVVGVELDAGVEADDDPHAAMATPAAPSADRTSRRRTGRPVTVRRLLVLSALGAAGVAMAACGSSSASTPASSSTPTTSRGSSASGSTTPRQFPGTSGTIAAINGTSLEVQNPTTGQVTVNYTSTTTFRQTVTASASAVTVGSCISAFGKPTSGSSLSK